MSDAEIEAFAARLEATVRVEDARLIQDSEYVESDHFLQVAIANRASFLHLAALLLRGAVAEENVRSVQFSGYDKEHFEKFFDFTERREVWSDEPVEEPQTSKERVSSFLWRTAGLLLFLIIMGLIYVGFNTVIDWIAR